MYRTTSYENAVKLWQNIPLPESEDFFRKMGAAFDAIEAHGVRLVPIEPTDDMIFAGGAVYLDGSKLTDADFFDAMLAASPYTPSSNDEKEEGR